MKINFDRSLLVHCAVLVTLIFHMSEADTFTRCAPYNESCGPLLPLIPKTIYAQMELTIPKQKRTLLVTEIFDLPSFRTRISIASAGLIYISIYDLKNREYSSLFFDPNDSSFDPICVAQPLNETSDLGMSFLLQDVLINEDVHILSGFGTLHSNPDIRFSFMGNASRVRDIPALQWNACYNPPNTNASLVIQYFWSDWNQWTPANGEKTVPLLAYVEVSAIVNNTIKNYNYSYNFIIFHSDNIVKDTDKDFEIQRGVYCLNYNRKKPFPKLPDQMSFFTEIIVDKIHSEKKFIINTNEFIDLKSDLIRTDYKTLVPEEIKKFGSREIIAILDYHSDVLYKIDRELRNCTVEALNASLINIVNGKKPLSAGDLFKLDVTDFEYNGKGYARDTVCDVWVGRKGNVTHEWYFLSEDWIDDAGSLAEKQVPIQVINYFPGGYNTDRVITSFFKFEKSYAGFPFDVSTCSGVAIQKHFQVTFTGTFTAEGDDLINIKSIFQKNIAEAISVPQIRVSNLDFLADADDAIVVEFTLLEKPSVPGKTVNGPDRNDPVLPEAVENLKKAVESQRPAIELPGSSVEKQFSMPVPGTLIELDSRNPCSSPVTSPTRTRIVKRSVYDIDTSSVTVDTYGGGQVAGLVVGFFVIGALVGIITMLLISHFWSVRPPQSNFRILFERDQDRTDQPTDQVTVEHNKFEYDKLEEEADA